MIFRAATLSDIPQMQIIRNAVKENTLSDPSLITDDDYKAYLTNRGKGWVCEKQQQMAGFAIVDGKENNIWALFILPEYENQGIGKHLHHMMLDWYFDQTVTTVWLGTEPHSRAAGFYRKMGWEETGTNGDKEIKFEMSSNKWYQLKNN